MPPRPAETGRMPPAPERRGGAGPSHYFDPEPRAPSEPRTVELVLPDLTVTLLADRGVFSAERIDPGTRLLLQTVPPPPPQTRHALDLGCGYGPVAVTLAHRAPQATVWAVDVNERAVALCRINARAADADRPSGGERTSRPSGGERTSRVRGGERTSRVRAGVVRDHEPWGGVPPGVELDLIWSNPPVRIGKPALRALLTRWLDRLAPAGRAYLVVQKHLGADSLQRWLSEQGWPTERVTSRAGYRVLAAGARPAAPPRR